MENNSIFGKLNKKIVLEQTFSTTLNEIERELFVKQVDYDSVLDDTPIPTESLVSYAFGAKMSKIINTFEKPSPLIEDKISKARKIITELKPMLTTKFYKVPPTLSELALLSSTPIVINDLKPGQALYQMLVARKDKLPLFLGMSRPSLTVEKVGFLK